jgi:hypothetical protein
MVEIRFSCCAASSAAFSWPQRPCKLLIIRGALKALCPLLKEQEHENELAILAQPVDLMAIPVIFANYR